jgi:predicted DCC family thiol-disulfide oxidoreductase YuxK
MNSSHQTTNSPIHQFPSVILFDGVCNLCNGFVTFVIARDPARRFQFGALQSPAAERLLRSFTSREPLPDSMVLVEGGRVWTQSAAALRVARGLAFPWPLAYVFVVVPRPLRDWIYNRVARNRYRWFGKRAVCMVPTPELRTRFIESMETSRRESVDSLSTRHYDKSLL